jgi:hypothetical protein
MQATFVQTRPGAALAPVLCCGQLEEPHMPLQCRHVKVQQCLCYCSLSMSKIRTGFCFQTSPGAAQASVG